MASPLRRKDKRNVTIVKANVSDMKSRLLEYRDEILDTGGQEETEGENNRSSVGGQDAHGHPTGSPPMRRVKDNKCNGLDFIRQSMHWEEFFGNIFIFLVHLLF